MKILAVDDDPIILELLAQFIETVSEHELKTALSGQEALEMLQTGPNGAFDCFLLDIQMPQMDGITLTQKIRGIKHYTETPILMLTAMSAKRYVDAAFLAGATDYVTKPFEVVELKTRLRLAEGQVATSKSRTGKIFAAKAISGPVQIFGEEDRLELNEPISIFDVDNVIDFMAMENYVAQLSRSDLFGSTTFAFSIRKIEDHHRAMSPFEFYSLVSDVAEVISDTLAGRQFLMSYAGSGTFVCVADRGWRPNMAALVDAVNLSLARTHLHDNTGQQLYVRVSGGEAIRLVWKSRDSVMEAVGQAHASAEAACEMHERAMKDLWLTEQHT